MLPEYYAGVTDVNFTAGSVAEVIGNA